MGNNVISDLKTAARIFKDIRQERKNGNTVTVKKSIAFPNISVEPSFCNTVEGCTLTNCRRNVDDIAREAFARLTCEEKCKLSFVPKDGEFIERANLWREILKPVMMPDQYHIAVRAILHRYIYIKKNNKKGVA